VSATVALPLLTKLKPEDLIYLKYDKIKVFKRAIKVFHLSYARILDLNFDIHKNISDAYVEEMREISDIKI
jgi:hypothetical protein